MICVWYRLVSSEHKLSGKLPLHISESNKCKWLIMLCQFLMIQVFSNIWNSQQNINIYIFLITVKQRLQDQFIQKWLSDIDNASRGEFYSHFKKELIHEPYLLRLKRGFRTTICKLRTYNIKFPFETGRWQRV
jgi:hypothetical protein